MARRLRHPYGWQYDICQSMRRRYGQLPCNKIGNDERGSDEAELQLHCGKNICQIAATPLDAEDEPEGTGWRQGD